MSQPSAYQSNYAVSFGRVGPNAQGPNGDIEFCGLPAPSVETFPVSALSGGNGRLFNSPETLANVEYTYHYISQPNTYTSSQTYGHLGPSIVRLNNHENAPVQNQVFSETRFNAPQIKSGADVSHSPYSQPAFIQASSQPILANNQQLHSKAIHKAPPQLSHDDKLHVKLFLSLVLNLVNDRKLKDSRSKSRSSSRKGIQNYSKSGQENIYAKKNAGSYQGISSQIDQRGSTRNLDATILMLEHSLNKLEKHNIKLVKENETLTNKLRGVEDISKLTEDPNWASNLKSSSNLSSLNSPFIKANNAMRNKSTFYRKGSREGHTYSDKVLGKIHENQKNSEIHAQIQDLQTQNNDLREKTTTYESEISELYHRIDKFDTLESSVAELIQENERLRQIVMKITGQVQHNF